jgi:hypothetical protein
VVALHYWLVALNFGAMSVELGDLCKWAGQDICVAEKRKGKGKTKKRGRLVDNSGLS